MHCLIFCKTEFAFQITNVLQLQMLFQFPDYFSDSKTKQ